MADIQVCRFTTAVLPLLSWCVMDARRLVSVYVWVVVSPFWSVMDAICRLSTQLYLSYVWTPHSNIWTLLRDGRHNIHMLLLFRGFVLRAAVLNATLALLRKNAAGGEGGRYGTHDEASGTLATRAQGARANRDGSCLCHGQAFPRSKPPQFGPWHVLIRAVGGHCIGGTLPFQSCLGSSPKIFFSGPSTTGSRSNTRGWRNSW